MTLGLVPRSARALSDHLNRMYRVFRGIDQDSIALRLATGGSFEVRHSVTNAPVFSVTDAGTAVTIGSEDLATGAVTSDKIANDTIVDADVNSGAAIGLSKLAHVGTGNVLRSNGAQNVAGQVVSGDIADGAIVNADVNGAAAIGYGKLALANSVLNADVNGSAAIAISKLAHVGTGNVLRSNGAQNVAGQVVDADVSGAAAVALAKLAHVGAGNVVRSNGTTNVGGPIVNADIAAAGTANIDGAKLADNSVPSIKLIGGATIPANSIDSSHIVNGSIATVDLAASAVTQAGTAAGATSGPAIAPGAPVRLQEMVVDLTCTGGAVLFAFMGVFQHAVAGGTVALDVTIDAGLQIRREYQAPVAGQNLIVSVLHVMPAVPAGVRRFELMWLTAGGNATAFSTQRGMGVIELKR